MDWLDLLAVQGTLKSLLQHHSSKVSILRCSAFFIVQLLHPYMTTGKTIALTRLLHSAGASKRRFLVLTIVNSGAMVIEVLVSCSILVSLGYMPSSGIAESYGNSIYLIEFINF